MIVVDVPNVSYRNYFAISSGHQYPAAYGLLRSLKAHTKRENCEDFIFCFDSLISLRREKYPQNYKKRKDSEDRKKVQEELVMLRYILEEVGYTTCQHRGAEADDMIAHVCKLTKGGKEILILSSDTDLYQLLDDEVSIWNPFSGRSFQVRDLWMKYELYPKEWVMFRSLVGNDKIEGVDRVGDKTAVSYIRGRLPENHYVLKNIKEAEEILKINRKLLTLPFEELSLPSKKEFLMGSPNPDTWDSVMRKYDLEILVGECP